MRIMDRVMARQPIASPHALDRVMADQALFSKIVELLQMRGKFEIQLVGVIPLDGLPTSNLFYKRPN